MSTMFTMASEPTPPRLVSARGVSYWRSFWYDEKGDRRSKGFGNANEVSEAKASMLYHRFMADWRVGKHDVPDILTVEDVVDRYNDHCKGYYRRADGTPTGEAATIAGALKIFSEMFGQLPADELGGPQLRAYAAEIAKRGSKRQTANIYMAKVRRMAKWALSEDLVPAEVVTKLASVAAVRQGAEGHTEAEGVDAVPDPYITAVLPKLPVIMQDMVRLQLATGMRPGELVTVRPVDIQTKSNPWLYQPAHHKTQHRQKPRKVYLGPEARQIIEPYLNRELMMPLFVPQEVQDQRFAAARDAYEPKPGQGDYRRWKSYEEKQANRTGHSRYNQAYTTLSYGRAIQRACKAAKVPKWTPGQLRHNAEQRIESHYLAKGLAPELARNAARVVLGHARMETTGFYASRDSDEAARVMEAIG